MPWLTGAFLFAVFASSGCPASTTSWASSWSSWGSFSANMRSALVAAVAVVLAAIYLLWSYQRMALRSRHERAPASSRT
jgi:NADH:ubiquinone oxidoreductase subunit 4 (subunit M)